MIMEEEKERGEEEELIDAIALGWLLVLRALDMDRGHR